MTSKLPSWDDLVRHQAAFISRGYRENFSYSKIDATAEMIATFNKRIRELQANGSDYKTSQFAGTVTLWSKED